MSRCITTCRLPGGTRAAAVREMALQTASKATLAGASLTPGRREPRRRGTSLLEIILAIAILGVSLAAIVELVRVGSMAGRLSSDLTTAQLICDAVLSEVACGALPAQSTGQSPASNYDTTGRWQYQISTTTLDEAGLLGIQVTVTNIPQPGLTPITFTLYRWMIDPAASASSQSSETSGTTGSSATGTPSSGSTSSGTTPR